MSVESRDYCTIMSDFGVIALTQPRYCFYAVGIPNENRCDGVREDESRELVLKLWGRSVGSVLTPDFPGNHSYKKELMENQCK